MNSAICISNDTIFDEVFSTEEKAEGRNTYVTEPMPVIKNPAFHQSAEEELHTSFEEAISDRILALHSRLSRLSNPILDVQYAERNTDAVFSSKVPARNITGSWERTSVTQSVDHVERVSRPASAWQRATIFTCSAMMFLLLGFDLMGLLVLHMH